MSLTMNRPKSTAMRSGGGGAGLVSLFSSSTKSFDVSKPKSVIDWQVSKPEVIRVSKLNIHYTSLRDLMLLRCDCASAASPVLMLQGEKSPRTRMKNHLLEQVARAYNMELMHVNKSTQFFPWNWQKLMSCTPLISFPPGLSAGGWFSGFSLSGTLRYLLGRSGSKQPVRFLKHRIC